MRGVGVAVRRERCFQSSLQGQGGLTLPRRHRAAQRSLEPVLSWLHSVSSSCPTAKSENPLVCSRTEERRIRAERESALPHWRHPIHPLPFLHIPSAVSGLLELKKEKKRKSCVLRLRHLEGKESMKEARVGGGVNLEKCFSNFLNFDS